MAAPGRPNACVTPSRRKIATAASAAVIRGIFLLLSFVSAGQLADRLEQRRMVKTAVSLRLERRDQLRDGGAERDHHAGFAGGGGDDAHVLVVQRDPEAGLEVAGQHGGALALEHGAAGQPAAQHPQRRLGVDAVGLEEHDRLGQQLQVARHDELVRGRERLTRDRAPARMGGLGALTVWPEPGGPTCTAVLPTASNTGAAAAKSSAAPPTMIESTPSMAPGSAAAPSAATTRNPRSAPSAASPAVTSGRMLEKSMTSAPALAWA